jgi:hypothetical protein
MSAGKKIFEPRRHGTYRRGAESAEALIYFFRVLCASVVKFFLGIAILSACSNNPPTQIPAAPTAYVSPAPSRTPTLAPPKTLPIADSPLKDAIINAGDYLARQQLPNGELSYQVDFMTGERAYSPVHLRLMGGTGALYTVCRVSKDSKYCAAGDLALKHYLRMLIADESKFKGTCLYAEGNCQLGGAALTIDTVYKRWQATGDFFLEDQNLFNTAVELGYFIVSMRKPDGGFYHAYDPYVGGMVDPDYFAANFPGESLLALLELYEMTGNDFWLKQAREVNAYMIAQPVTEDHWHAYAFSKLAQADSLSAKDLDYAKKIADVIILGGVRSLNPQNSSISTANKIEGLSALAQAFKLSKTKYEKLDAEIPVYVTFVHARQLPANDCGWDVSAQVEQTFGGGIFTSCAEPSIRVDGLQNWINGVAAYLEYLGMGK